MRVIDPRSGKTMKVGDTVTYPQGESLTLLDVDPGIFSASATVRHTYADYSKPDRPLITKTHETELQVRWFHPMFLFQHVAFIPS